MVPGGFELRTCRLQGRRSNHFATTTARDLKTYLSDNQQKERLRSSKIETISFLYFVSPKLKLLFPIEFGDSLQVQAVRGPNSVLTIVCCLLVGIRGIASDVANLTYLGTKHKSYYTGSKVGGSSQPIYF